MQVQNSSLKQGDLFAMRSHDVWMLFLAFPQKPGHGDKTLQGRQGFPLGAFHEMDMSDHFLLLFFWHLGKKRWCIFGSFCFFTKQLIHVCSFGIFFEPFLLTDMAGYGWARKDPQGTAHEAHLCELRWKSASSKQDRLAAKVLAANYIASSVYSLELSILETSASLDLCLLIHWILWVGWSLRFGSSALLRRLGTYILILLRGLRCSVLGNKDLFFFFSFFFS